MLMFYTPKDIKVNFSQITHFNKRSFFFSFHVLYQIFKFVKMYINFVSIWLLFLLSAWTWIKCTSFWQYLTRFFARFSWQSWYNSVMIVGLLVRSCFINSVHKLSMGFWSGLCHEPSTTFSLQRLWSLSLSFYLFIFTILEAQYA